jgi:hypothetical protein
MTKSRKAMMERLTALYGANSFIVKWFKELCENPNFPDSSLETIVKSHELNPNCDLISFF